MARLASSAQALRVRPSNRLIHGFQSLAFVNQTEQFGHLLVEKAFAGTIGLHPFAVDYELRDSAFAGVANDFVGGAGVLSMSMSV
jgi:hypothetical protein